jgi:hypothetical protein
MVLFIGVFVAYFLLGSFAPESSLLTLGWEDQPLEYMGAVFWASAALLCAYRLIKRQEPMLLLAMWMVLTTLFFGEEISWFQRILGFETPEAVRAVNAQDEFNLHNLEGLGIGFFGIQNMFRLGFLVYFLVFPALTISDRVRSWAARVGYVRPSGAFLLMVWGVIAASGLVQLAAPDEARRALVETRESFYAFSVLVYVFLYLRPEALTQDREVRGDVPA